MEHEYNLRQNTKKNYKSLPSESSSSDDYIVPMPNKNVVYLGDNMGGRLKVDHEEVVAHQPPWMNLTGAHQPTTMSSPTASQIDHLPDQILSSSSEIDIMPSPVTTGKSNDESTNQETQDAQLDSPLSDQVFAQSPSLNVFNDQSIGKASTSRIDQLSAPQISQSSIIVQSTEVNNISTK